MWSGLAARLDHLDLPRSLRLPIWKEARARGEVRAAGLLPPPEPTPHPRDIVLVPGFLDDGRGVRPLAARLEAAGHRPRVADIGRNIACAEVMAGRLADAVQRTVDEVGGRAVLIGHSHGGTLSRVVTVRHQDLVAGLVTAGSPLADLGQALRDVDLVVGVEDPRAQQMAGVRGDGIHPNASSSAAPVMAGRWE